jgi:hypothetical protein
VESRRDFNFIYSVSNWRQRLMNSTIYQDGHLHDSDLETGIP